MRACEPLRGSCPIRRGKRASRSGFAECDSRTSDASLRRRAADTPTAGGVFFDDVAMTMQRTLHARNVDSVPAAARAVELCRELVRGRIAPLLEDRLDLGRPYSGPLAASCGKRSHIPSVVKRAEHPP